MPWGPQSAPSDQGAYLSFYTDTKKYLDKKFNYKPYWKGNPRGSKITHFHGPKPHQYFGYALDKSSCGEAVKFLCNIDQTKTHICWALRHFSKALVQGPVSEGLEHTTNYCRSTFTVEETANYCVQFFKEMSENKDPGLLVGGECLNHFSER